MVKTLTDYIEQVSLKAVYYAPKIRVRVILIHLLLSGLAIAGIVLERGFYHPPVNSAYIHLFQAICLGLYWISVFYRRLTKTMAMPQQRVTWADFIVLGIILVGGGLHIFSGFPEYGWIVVEIGAVLTFIGELWRINVVLSRRLNRPGLLFPLSFLLMIAVGTALLKLPVAVPVGQHISWLDSLFMMTSSVCVTGLSVRNLAAGFTPFGQAVICLFIQLGGLGIIIFGSTLALLLGRSLSLRENMNLSSMLADQPLFRLSNFVRFIVITTLIIEAIGALCMYPLWHAASGQPPLTTTDRLAYSAFHAVSAFCNAGFSITGSNLTGYRYSLISQAIIAPLIALGGIGFPVLLNLLQTAKHKVRTFLRRGKSKLQDIDLSYTRLTLHTKLALTTTMGVYLFGIITITGAQLMPYAYQHLGWGVAAGVKRPAPLTISKVGGILADSNFLTIDSRTAGFSTFNLDKLQTAGTLSVMAQMAIGGSPASTAGGIKTTVLALLILSIFSTIKRDPEIRVFGRTISETLVRRAAALAICYVAMVFIATFLLCLTESFPFQKILFEVISAASTVGLSLGITPDLSSIGKIIIVITMYLGRIGPLAMMGALVLSNKRLTPYSFPHENVVLG